MLDHGRIRQLAAALLPLLLVALGVEARPALAQQPTSITFVVPHAACFGEGGPSALDFYVNEHHVGTLPTRNGCECSPPEDSTFAFTAPEIVALLDLSSCNTFRVDAAEALREWLSVSPPRPGQAALLEEFILGDEFSFDSVTIGGSTIWSSISCYTPGPLEVQENAWIQWCVLLPRDISGSAFEQIADAGPRALAELGLDTGLTHMEWFRRRNGSIAISEVAVRPPGAQFTSLISYAHDFDLYRAWARLVVSGEFTPPERKYAAGAAYLRGQGQGRVKAIHGLDEIQREIGALIVEAKLPKPGDAPRPTYEGDGYVIVRHPETAKVEQALGRLVRTVRIELG